MIQLPGFYGNTATEAIRTAAARRILPTWLGSADLAEVAQHILDRAYFSARTTNAIYLEALRERISRLLSDGYEGDQAQLRLELQQILAELGYDPEFGFPGDEELGIPPARPGSLQDLSSDARINLILETQLELMAGKGQEQRGLQPEALDLFPAWELVRLRPVRMPRDWPKRWEKAGGRALIDADGRLRLAAGKLDEIWSVLGDKAVFRDALGVSHPPFCFRSGMGWAPIEADDWDALLKLNGRRAEATAQEPPASAKELPPAVVSTDGLSDETLAKLKQKLEGVEAKGGKLTLGGIITTPPPPPPPSRLRRLNALRDAVLCAAMVAEVNGKARRARRAAGETGKGKPCGASFIAPWKQCGKTGALSKDEAVSLLSSDRPMTDLQLAEAVKAAPHHHHARLLEKWFGKGHQQINGSPKSKEAVALVQLMRRVKPEERSAPLFRGLRFPSAEAREAWVSQVKAGGGWELSHPLTAASSRQAVAAAFARSDAPLVWRIDKPVSARNLTPVAEALGAKSAHQQERVFLPGSRLELKGLKQETLNGRTWVYAIFAEASGTPAGGS